MLGHHCGAVDEPWLRIEVAEEIFVGYYLNLNTVWEQKQNYDQMIKWKFIRDIQAFLNSSLNTVHNFMLCYLMQ